MKCKKIISAITAILLAASGAGSIFDEQPLTKNEPVLYGDINRDGAVTVKDITILKKFLCGIETLSDTQKIYADVNNDSELNVIDFIIIKNMLLEAGVPMSVIENAVASPNMESFIRSYEQADTKGYNEFTANSAAVLFSDNDKVNPVYSPISVYMALSMLAECTDGKTQKELTDVLCANDIDELRKSNNDIFNNLYFEANEGYNEGYCKIANSIWLNDLYKYNSDTLRTLADSYYTSSFTRNFAAPETGNQISQWIYKNTSGKLNPKIEINDPAEEIIKIINTVTFKNSWADEFGESRKDIFHTSGGEDKECEFLNKTFENSYIEYGEGFMKTSVPMMNSYKMNFVLPDEDTTVDKIVSSPQTLLDIVDGNTTKKNANVIFSVPEFKVSSKFDLIEWAKKLGITTVFEADASDFTRITTDISDLYVSEITHEATIEIDEKGCEAAAYTLIAVDEECYVEPAEEKIFRLDRPFYYYVSDRNGTPVFSGIINDPAAN